MKQVDLSKAVWRTSSYSSGNGQCVEVAHVSEVVAMRDSKDPAGSALVFTSGEFNAFLRGVTDGQFNQL